jgi:endo-1,3(4)-beta-glucanase
MLAVQARSLSNYVLMQNDNTVQPANYIPNKVAGITFENKVDHTTYFGGNIEYIQGYALPSSPPASLTFQTRIHMIPVASHTGFIRPSAFITQEWATYFDNGRVDAIDSGWKGIIYADYAFVDPKASWAFFSQADFNQGWLDGGASQTWYLALAAMLGGAS